MVRGFKTSRESPGGGEIGVSEGVFEGELDLGVRFTAPGTTEIRGPTANRWRSRWLGSDANGVRRSAAFEAKLLIVDKKLIGLEPNRRGKQ